VGVKLIIVLLAMAPDIFRKKTNKTTINTRFANNIQSFVNTRLLGSIHCLKHWKVPFNEKSDKTRLFIDNLHVLIAYVFTTPADKEQKEIWLKL
jgi:hypothetical protein